MKFRCKRSGNIMDFTFDCEDDLKFMRQNESYEEVILVLQEEVKKTAEEVMETVERKKLGRPKK